MSKKDINLENMSAEAIENLAEQVGIKINAILLKAKKDCNKLLNNMGLDIELGYEIKAKPIVAQSELNDIKEKNINK